MGLTIIDTLSDGSQVTKVAGTVTVEEVPATSSTITQVAFSSTSVALLASDPLRRGFTLYNNSTRVANVAFGPVASTIAFTVIMPPGSYYEAPVHYTGAVSAVWSGGANGTMQVTAIVL